MAVKFSLLESKCNFKTKEDNISCSLNKISLENVPADTRTVLLTESGFLPTELTRAFIICENHHQKLLKQNRSRAKSKLCSVPDIICSHKKDNQKRTGWYGVKADRAVTEQKIIEIQSVTGIVVPIGTPICANCRKALTKSTNTDFEPSIVEAKASSEQNVAHDEVFGEAYNLRNKQQQKYYESDDTLSSQDTAHEFNAADSQGTEASVVKYERLDKLNEFLDTCGISPVKCLNQSLKISSDRTQRRYISKARECCMALLDTVCPDDAEFIKKALFVDDKSASIATTSSLLKSVSEAYMRADTSTLRCQLLSILTNDYSIVEVNTVIPALTKYKYYAARKHKENIGIGFPVPSVKALRCKIDDGKLEHFLDFITSNHIVKDLPFGEKTLQLSSGELIQTPNVIRSLAPATLIRQYSQLCEDEDFQSLGTSTMYRILADCSASVRHSIEGLDYYIAEGGQAFRDLEEIVQELDLTLHEKNDTLERLVAAKHYLKTDYKLHVRSSSSTADHCCLFALSEQSGAFSKECADHDHTNICGHCSFLNETLSHISQKTAEKHWDNPEAFSFKVDKAVSDIHEWKRHILRSKNQERARQDILNSITEGEVFIIADWAMKFLPRKYREGQTDWFAKRGINWHIAFTVYNEGGSLKHLTHVHIFNTPVPQDASTTAALLTDVSRNVCLQLPNVRKVSMWSDNAGCYKSTLTMALLHQELGDKIKVYHFCEAQDGKGPCDRKASHIKSAIKRYVNEGNDVTNAHQMKQAIDSKQHGEYKVKVLCPVINADAEKLQLKNIPAISTLHNFKFTDTGLTVWRAYATGPGKFIPWNNIGANRIPIVQFIIQDDWTDEAFTPLNSEVVSNGDEDEGEENTDTDEPIPKKRKVPQRVFQCPEEGCIRLFRFSSSLDQHLLLGNCDLREEKLSLKDKSMVMYAKKLDTGSLGKSYTKQLESSKVGVPALKCGWALKVKKPKIPFTDDQKAFMQEKFLIGKTSGRKEDPSKVAEEMRYSVRNGTKRFSKEQYLTSQQIASYFSRMVQKDKKMDQDDLIAANANNKSFVLKQDVLKEISL